MQESDRGYGGDTARGYRVIWVAIGLSALFTAVVTLTPSVRFGYRSPELHVALDTAVGLTALLAGYLVYGRFAVTRSRRDLLLTMSLLVLGPTNLLLSAFPSITFGVRDDFYVWAAAGGRLLGAVLFASSGFIPDRILARREPVPLWLLLIAAVAGTIVVAGVFGSVALEPGIPPALSPESSTRPMLVGHPLLLGLQLTAMILYAAATVGLARRARQTGDELLLWLAAGAAMLAFSRLNYFLFPSIYSQWVYTGDVLRIGAHVLFLIGAAREIRTYWGRLRRLAVIEERRRVARDLHDGIAQELALIAGQSHMLDLPASAEGSVAATAIRSASERALREARAAISALTERPPEPLDVVVGKAAEEAADRAGIDVELDLDRGIAVSLDVHEMLSRVTGEAVANAGRHAQADRIRVSLWRERRRVVLCIEDDGVGFDPSRPSPGGGYGLTSMRERAEQLGADFVISSRPGHGTRIEVSVTA